MKHTERTFRNAFGAPYFRPRASVPGFTLVELLVVLGIMTVIMGLFIFNQGRFNSAILLRSLGYQIAITIREAQVYGIAVRETASGSGNFRAGYGVYFSASSPTSYIFFADLNNDKVFDSLDTVIDTYAIGNGFALNTFCATRGDGIERCAPTDISNLTITFKRPNPEAFIRTNIPGETYATASITVASPQGSTRTVTVGTTGEIGVQQTGN